MKQSLRAVGAVVLLSILVLPLIIHAIAAFSSRPLADDYCFTYAFNTYGIGGSLDYWYHSWTGIYSGIILQGFIGAYNLHAVTPTILIALWLLSTIFTAYQLITHLQLPPRFRLWLAFIWGTLFVLVVNEGLPNVVQTLYWTAGNIGYIAPMIVFTFQIGLILYAARLLQQNPQLNLLPYLALCAGLSMFGGGFNTLVTAFQVAAFGFAALMVLWLSPPAAKRPLILLLVISIAFYVISLLILASAPGNLIRQTRFPDRLPIPIIIGLTVYGSILFIPTSAGFLSPLAPLAALVGAAAIALNFHPLTSRQQIYMRKNSLKLIVAVSIIGFLLINASFLPAIYVFSDMPSARAYLVPQTVLMATASGWGYVMGLGMQKEYAGKSNRLLSMVGYGLIGVMLLGFMRSTMTTINLIPTYQTFAAEWDARDRQLTAAANAGETSVTLAPFSVDLATYADLESTDEALDGVCAANNYGLTNIQVTSQ